jgi:ATP-dependent DNA ligase
VQTFKFASKSSPNTEYTAVVNDNGVITCNCKGYTMRNARECTHTKQIRKKLGLPEGAPVPKASQLDLLKSFEEVVPTEGFIEPMLASALKEGMSMDDFENGNALGWVAEEKLDGHRLIVRVTRGNITAWSRAANTRALPPRLFQQCYRLAEGTYDGELCIAGEGAVSTDVTAKHLMDKTHLVLFDILRVGETPCMDLPLVERRMLLNEAVSKSDCAVISVVPQHVPSRKLLKRIWDAGGEGLVIKRNASRYLPGKRSADWIKFKKEQAAVLTVTDFEKGLLGPHSKVVLVDDAGVQITVKTRNDKWRARFAQHAPRFIGAKMTISYQFKTRDGKYRHPMADHFVDSNLQSLLDR